MLVFVCELVCTCEIKHVYINHGLMQRGKGGDWNFEISRGT